MDLSADLTRMHKRPRLSLSRREDGLAVVTTDVVALFEQLEQSHSELMARMQRLESLAGHIDPATVGSSSPPPTPPTSISQELVVLNVGGQEFTTRISTLCRVPGSFLEALVSGRHQVARTSSGAIFVDRDPTHFRLILAWLRDPAAPLALPVDDPSFLHEVRYFGLSEAMLHLVEHPLPKYVYAMGGFDGSRVFDVVEKLDTVTGRWSPVVPLPSPRHWCGAAVVDDVLYVIGGEDLDNPVASVGRFNLHTAEWTAAMPLSVIRCDMGCCTYDGKIYVVGGYDESGKTLASMECYDPDADTWTSLAPLQTPRERVRLTSLNGKLFAVGGYDGQSYLATVERYDPNRDCWDYVAPMKTPRASAAVTTLEGKIYAFSGFDGRTHSATFEVYDSNTNTWCSSRSPMPSPRYRAGCCAVGSRAYIIGGYKAKHKHVPTVDVFDATSETWARVGDLGEAARSDVSCCAASI